MKKKVIMLSMLAITAAMLTACSDKNDAADVPEVSLQKKVQKIRIQIHLQKQRRNPQRMSKKIRRSRVQTM